MISVDTKTFKVIYKIKAAAAATASSHANQNIDKRALSCVANQMLPLPSTTFTSQFHSKPLTNRTVTFEMNCLFLLLMTNLNYYLLKM